MLLCLCLITSNFRVWHTKNEPYLGLRDTRESIERQMEFCGTCDNLLYLKSEENHRLVKYCKCCGFSKTEEAMRAFKVSSTLYSEDDLLYAQCQNKYLRFDPTLPRVRDPDPKLACPNPDCSGPKDQPQVLYVKYHPVHMKYFYCCDYCSTTWKADK